MTKKEFYIKTTNLIKQFLKGKEDIEQLIIETDGDNFGDIYKPTEVEVVIRKINTDLVKRIKI